jgi:hypothetical protein
MVQARDDASLQGWGRDLSSIGPALGELANVGRASAEQAEAAVAGLGRLAALGSDELPADRGLVAEVQGVHAEASRWQAQMAEAAAGLASLSARADGLPAAYRVAHDTDEGRLAGERGGVEREKRADVGRAEQDT